MLVLGRFGKVNSPSHLHIYLSAHPHIKKPAHLFGFTGPVVVSDAEAPGQKGIIAGIIYAHARAGQYFSLRNSKAAVFEPDQAARKVGAVMAGGYAQCLR